MVIKYNNFLIFVFAQLNIFTLKSVVFSYDDDDVEPPNLTGQIYSLEEITYFEIVRASGDL